MKMLTPYLTAKKSFLTRWVFLIFFLGPGMLFSGIANSFALDWQTIDTKNATIHFQDLDDLRIFNSKILFTVQIDNATISEETNHYSSLTAEAIKKTDALFIRSRNLLDMHGFMNKINVKLFKNKQQLNDAFYALYKAEGNARAWYTHEKMTIYVQLEDLHEGMLAHEMAHSIIDHYLIIPPPHGTAEILARYVDTHLKDENKVAEITHEHGNEKVAQAQVKGYSTLSTE